MRLNRLFFFIALLLVLPVCGFGQKVTVAPSMLLNVGGLQSSVYVSDMEFDAQGNIYVAGRYSSDPYWVDFDPSSRTAGLPVVNGGYVAKYSSAGALVWVKEVGNEATKIEGLDIDQNGNITLIGSRHNNRRIPDALFRDAFILHLDNDGNVLWEKRIESGTKPQPAQPDPFHLFQDLQEGRDIASDANGNLIGVFTFGGAPEVDGTATAKGNHDGLVVKFGPNGTVIWKFNLGATGSYENSALKVVVDQDNNILIAGFTEGTVDYNPLGTPVNITANDALFLAKYSPDGILQWIKSIKGSQNRYNVKLALDGQDNIYINGSFSNSLDFGGASALTANGPQDVFIAKYSTGGSLLYQKNIGGSGGSILNGGLATGPGGNLYLTGIFQGKVDVDPSSSVSEFNSNAGAMDMFVVKYDDNGSYQTAFRVPRIVSGEMNNLSIDQTPFELGARDIHIDNSDDIFLTGSFSSTVNFNGTGCGVNSLTAKGVNDMFIVRYSPTEEIPVTNNSVRAPAVTDICEGVDPGPIIGSVPIGEHFTYQWQQSLDNRTFTDMTGETLKDFDPPVLSATTYYRRRLVTSECAAPNISNVVTLTYFKAAAPNTITQPFDILFCNAGNAAPIRGSLPQAVGNVDYQWQESPDGINFTDISRATGIDFDPPPLTVTTHYRRLITNSPCNIGTPSNTVIVTIVSVPVPTVSEEKTICTGEGVTLIATGGIRYAWSPAVGLSSTEGESPVAKPTLTTTYTVTVFNGYCSYPLQVRVIVVDRPTVNAGADKEIMNGDMVRLDALVGHAEGATYSWTPATYLDDPAIANPMASPVKSITYRLTVKSVNGCFTVSDDVVVNVRERLVVPNAFSPNGDGVNDVLRVPELDSNKQSTFTIFDRNGQPIFRSLAYPKPWDGTHNGKPLPTGTYYYIIELNNAERKRLSGYVSLIR